MERALFTNPVEGAVNFSNLFMGTSQEETSAVLDQLSGLCAGILADGHVSESEADFFADWVQKTAELKPVWPLTEIVKRIRLIYQDGRCDDAERLELKAIMESICGVSSSPPQDASQTEPHETPFDTPAPESLTFPGKKIALTGLFAFGTQSNIKRQIEIRGATVLDQAPTETTDYLVVGVFATQEWESGAFGRDVSRGLALKDQGASLIIVPEEALVRSLESRPA